MLEEPAAAAARGALTKEQQLGVALLVIFAIITLGLGLVQIRNNLYGPVALNKKLSPTITDELTGADVLRFRDTDHDGLTDFDELYVYTTSPYLYDTFSYGLSDKEVIAQGLPLCPKGQDCASPVTSGGAELAAASSSLPVAIPNPGAPPPDLLKILTNPVEVRQMLRRAGTDPKLLEKVSDAELMFLVKDVLSNTSTMETIRSVSGLSGEKNANSPKP